MVRIEIDIPDELKSNLVKRARKNYQTLSELTEDIIRRSMLNYTGKTKADFGKKADDSLVGIFSREKKGRKRK
ncbi:MAG: hypothetical protein AABY10_05915 [Nanoarchaeota archaeon]